ncbi:MAG TPA: hypothetical protein VMT46_09150 [Anaerolineaceae bacterium]|nr:hypothetical protein [Anaerolineaceae bacterium]
MLANVTHILPLTTIRRERVLPTAGRVVVRAAQKVAATDVIAEARLVTQHQVLDVSRGLGVSPDQAEKYITRKIGEDVSQGDVVAGPVGIFPRVIRTPKDGRVVAIGGGQVLIELESRPFELLAGIPGMVTDLIPDRGAIVETTGALIQGIWGNGQIDSGVLVALAQTADEELTAERFDVSMRGSILLGGTCTQADTLHAAAQVPLRGLVLGSMTGDLAPVALQLKIPILVLEGFGKLPINPAALKILTTNEKREIAVNACVWNRLTGERPEVVIHLPAAGPLATPREADIFAPGQTVRIVRSPNSAAAGTLVALRPGQTTFPSGIRAPGAAVKLENGDQVVVPLANLEVVE